MKKSYQKVVVIVSGLALLATMTMGGFSFQQSPSSSSPQSNAGTTPSPDERLQSIIQGYEAVLQREPDNSTAKLGLEEALKTLVATQIQAQNLEQAIPPMEKLAVLVPDNEQYQDVLKQLKQAKASAATATPPTQPSATNPNSDEPLPLIIPEAEPETNPLLIPETDPNSNPLVNQDP
jgi:hypothetical protein